MGSSPISGKLYKRVSVFAAAGQGHGKFAALRATNRTKKTYNSWISRIVLRYDHGHCDSRAPVV